MGGEQESARPVHGVHRRAVFDSDRLGTQRSPVYGLGEEGRLLLVDFIACIFQS